MKKDVVKLSKKHRSIWQSRVWFWMPGALGVGFFSIVPFGETILLSFSRGLSSYQAVLKNEAFRLAACNMLRFVITGIPLLLFLSFLIAIGIYKSRWMQLIKSLYLLPMAVPVAVVVFIWKIFFHKEGLCNQMLAAFHITPVDWMSGNAAFYTLVISYLWKNLGYAIVLWIAGMAKIPESIIEAAKVDGATDRQCISYMILPQLKPVCYTAAMLSFLNSFKIFREAYLVAGAYPPQSIYLLGHLFHNWFINLEIEKMSAAAVILATFFSACSLLLQKTWEAEEMF